MKEKESSEELLLKKKYDQLRLKKEKREQGLSDKKTGVVGQQAQPTKKVSERDGKSKPSIPASEAEAHEAARRILSAGAAAEPSSPPLSLPKPPLGRKLPADAPAPSSGGFKRPSVQKRRQPERVVEAAAPPVDTPMPDSVLEDHEIPTEPVAKRPRLEPRGRKGGGEFTRRPRESKGAAIFVGDLEPGTEKEELREAFKSFGEIEEVRVIEGMCYGFVTFASMDMAQAAIAACDAHTVQVAGATVRGAWAHGSMPRWKTETGPDPDAVGLQPRILGPYLGEDPPEGIAGILASGPVKGAKATMVSHAIIAAEVAARVDPASIPKTPGPAVADRQLVAYDDLI